RAGRLQGTGGRQLRRVWASSQDPFIGSQQLPAGTPATGPITYYVAVSSNETLPTALDAQFKIGSTNQQVRLQPVDSVQRIVEDHIGFTGYTTGDVSGQAHVSPTTGAILPINTIAQLQAEVATFTLSDVALFGVSGSHLQTDDAFSGTQNFDIGQFSNAGVGNVNNTVIKMRS